MVCVDFGFQTSKKDCLFVNRSGAKVFQTSKSENILFKKKKGKNAVRDHQFSYLTPLVYVSVV